MSTRRRTRRVGPADGGTDDRWRMPTTAIPDPLIRGIRGWVTDEGWTVLRLHYTADPDRADREWIEAQVKGYRGGFEGRGWRREMEIDFEAYAGEPVYAFSPSSVRPTLYDPSLPLWRGWDFGYRHPAVVWGQLWPARPGAPEGVLVLLHELYPTLGAGVPGLKTADLAKMVLAETAERFPDAGVDAPVLDFCDPSGNQTKETSDFSSIEILQQHGIEPEWSVVGRKNRIEYARRYVEVPASFRVNPHCTLTIKALAGAYRYPEDTAGTADRDMPDLGKRVQNEPYIHLMDAFEYIVACNLQVANLGFAGPKQTTEEKRIGSLAEMYLGVTAGAPDRLATSEAQPVHSALEEMLSDLVGDEGDLTNAWASPSI